MLKRLPLKYSEQINNLQSLTSFVDPDFEQGTQYFTKLSLLNLKKSLSPCSEFKRSQYYQDNSIINALSILQQDMQFVKNILEYNNQIYGVWLNLGEWVLVIVDENIPCYLTGNITKLATMECEYEWPLIIEKAIVKVLGKKYDILNRLIEESIESLMFMLTGAPIHKVVTADLNNLRNVLKAQLELRSLLFVVKRQNGLEYGYTVQSITNNQIQLRAANRSLVLQVFYEYKQNSNDKCIFYLSIDQFAQLFQELYIIKAQHTFSWNGKLLTNPVKRDCNMYVEHTYIYDFELTKDSHIYISVCQRDQNLNSAQLVSSIKYGLVRTVVCEKKDDNYQFITGDFNLQQNLTMELQQLPAGNYSIFCQAYFLNSNPTIKSEQQKLNLQFFGSEVPIHIQPNIQDFQETSKQMLVSLALALTENENTRTYEKLEQPEIQVTTQMNLGMLYFYYRNMGTTKIEEEVTFDKCDNMIDYITMKASPKFQVTVPPHNDYLVLYVFDPLAIFQINQPVFQYSCSIKSLVHSTKKMSMSMSRSRAFYNKSMFDSSDTNPSIELIHFMKDNGKQAQRIWNNQPIDVLMYVYQHPGGIFTILLGVIILYLNYTQNIYEEKMNFELQNLKINCDQTLKSGDQVQFQLDSYAHLFIYLEVIDSSQPYSHKIQSIYNHFK